MKRLPVRFACLLGCAVAAGAAHAESPADHDPVPQARSEAEAWFEKTTDSFLRSRLGETEKLLEDYRKHARYIGPRRRADLAHIRKIMPDLRPDWWEKVKSERRISFEARIWGRDFTTNYMPTDILGAQAPVGIRRSGTLLVVVTWRPGLVEDTRPAKGARAEAHQLRNSDIAEAIIWHELGHNYVSRFLPVEHVIKLYDRHRDLFFRLQEFYADMTSLRHSSPAARRVCLLCRIEELKEADDDSPHYRAAYAIGALLLREVLRNPKRWPSFHLPANPAETDTELQTILYLYHNLPSKLTVQEDRLLVHLVNRFIRNRGERVLRHRGRVPLVGGSEFELTPGRDEDERPKRDRWVRQRLEYWKRRGLVDEEDRAMDDVPILEIPYDVSEPVEAPAG